MNRKFAFRSMLAGLVALLTLDAAPAHASHATSSIHALAIDPGPPHTIYVGTWGGGVLKSLDGGATWSATALTDVVITALLIDLQTPASVNGQATLYAGTHDAGVFKSSDGGQTWVPLIHSGFGVSGLVMHPTDPLTLYAGTTYPTPDGMGVTGAVAKTVDGGMNWTLSPLPDGVRTLAIDPKNPATLYAGTEQYVGEWFDEVVGNVYKSTDAGASWVPTMVVSDRVMALLISAGNPNTVYAATEYGAIYQGPDGVWEQIGWTGAPTSALAIDSRTPPTLYAGTNNGVFKSADGLTWTATGLLISDVFVSVLAVAPANPDTLYAGTFYDGIFKSIDGGSTWVRTGLITWPHLESVSLNPVELTGGSSSIGTVTLSQAPPADAVVRLASYDTSVAAVPASVIVRAGTTSTTFTVSTNQVYWSRQVLIGANYAGFSRSAELTVTPGASPSITTHPANQTVQPGASVMFTVRASGPGQLRFQWQRNGLDIPGATAQDYTIASVTQSENGARFRARVTNDFGDVISNEAVLTVNPVITLLSIAINPTSVLGGSTSTGTVTLSAAAPSGGAVIALLSSDSAVAAVPPSMNLPSGTTTASFPISTSGGACATRMATISATYGDVTRSGALTVTPTMDTITVQRAEYIRGRNLLRVWATSSMPTAILQVFVNSSDEPIGTLSNLGGGSYSGQFAWPVNPQSITIRSSACGSATQDLAK